MRVKTSWFFAGDRGLDQFEAEWNAIARNEFNNIIGGAIALWEDDPDYARFASIRRRYEQLGRITLISMAHETFYSDREVVSSEIVTLELEGMINVNSASFVADEVCGECHRRIVRQISDCKIEEVTAFRDGCYLFCEINGRALAVGRAVSNRVRAVLEGLPGVLFRDMGRSTRVRPEIDIHQMIVTARLPPLDKRTHVEYDPLLVCGSCGNPQHLGFPITIESRDRELWFPRFETERCPIGLTSEALGRQDIVSECNHQLVATGHVYSAIVGQDAVGMGADPAHMI